MKIAIIGAGAAGSVFAGFMRRGGAEMYLVDLNREHMDAIRDNGYLHFTFVNYEEVREWNVEGFHTAYDASNLGVMDYVVYMVKTTASDAAIKGSLNLYGPETVAVSLQNGLGNEVKLAEYFPKNRIIYGNGTMNTLLERPGSCKGISSGQGSLINFGPAEQSEFLDEKGKALMELIRTGGCECEYTRDIAYVVWKKAMRNVAINPLIALLRFSSYYMVSDENLCGLIKDIFREGCDVANAMGIDGEKLYAWLLETLDYDYSGALGIISSTAYDMLIYKKKTEIDSLNGAIVKYGKLYGVPTPINLTITRLVKGTENHYDVIYTEEELKTKFY